MIICASSSILLPSKNNSITYCAPHVEGYYTITLYGVYDESTYDNAFTSGFDAPRVVGSAQDVLMRLTASTVSKAPFDCSDC